MHTSQGTGGAILLVDDDSSVRQFVAAILRNAGYHFFAAADAVEAQELFTQHGPAIDLLLTDVVMPGLSGIELAVLLIARKPALRVVLMSGNSPATLKPAFALEPGRNFLQKPFSIRQMRDCLEKHVGPGK